MVLDSMPWIPWDSPVEVPPRERERHRGGWGELRTLLAQCRPPAVRDGARAGARPAEPARLGSSRATVRHRSLPTSFQLAGIRGDATTPVRLPSRTGVTADCGTSHWSAAMRRTHDDL